MRENLTMITFNNSAENISLLNSDKIKNWHIFLAFVVLNLIVSWLFQEFIMTKEIYFHLLSDRVEEYRIDRQMEMINKFKLWGYLILPVLLWLKYVLVALLLQLPLMLKFIDIPFKNIFRVVILASTAMIIMNIVQFLWLYSIPVEKINENFLKVTPLSISALVNISLYPESAISILSTFNIFEGIWLFLLFMGFVMIARDRIKKNDIAILVFGVWTFLLLIQYSLVVYLEKAFG